MKLFHYVHLNDHDNFLLCLIMHMFQQEFHKATELRLVVLSWDADDGQMYCVVLCVMYIYIYIVEAIPLPCL